MCACSSGVRVNTVRCPWGRGGEGGGVSIVQPTTVHLETEEDRVTMETRTHYTQETALGTSGDGVVMATGLTTVLS